MAINFKDLKNKIENPELTADDIKIVDEIEKIMDIQITEQANKGNYKEILIEKNLVAGLLNNIPDHKITGIFEELKVRYKAASWKLEYNKDNSRNLTKNLSAEVFEREEKQLIAVLRGKNQRQVKKE